MIYTFEVSNLFKRNTSEQRLWTKVKVLDENLRILNVPDHT